MGGALCSWHYSGIHLCIMDVRYVSYVNSVLIHFYNQSFINMFL